MFDYSKFCLLFRITTDSNPKLLSLKFSHLYETETGSENMTASFTVHKKKRNYWKRQL